MKKFSYLALFFGVVTVGCAPKPAEKTDLNPTPPTTTEPAPVEAKPVVSGIGGTSDLGSKKPLDGEEVAVVETKFGRIVFRFFEDKAPKNVANIKKLAKEGFYNGTKFHRTMKGFMIQGGDPNTKTADKASYGTGGPGYNTPDEFSALTHERGILSMANSGSPNSGGSQFFMVQANSAFLDMKYTVFGRVCFDGTEKAGAAEPAGLAVIDKIVALPTEGPNKDLAVNPIEMKMAIKQWPLK